MNYGRQNIETQYSSTTTSLKQINYKPNIKAGFIAEQLYYTALVLCRYKMSVCTVHEIKMV